MVKYKLIIEYLKKGNNFTQVATLCGCSRMTVWRVVQRLNSLTIELVDYQNISEEELTAIRDLPKICFSNNHKITAFIMMWFYYSRQKHKI